MIPRLFVLVLIAGVVMMSPGCALSPYKVTDKEREAEIAYGKAAHESLKDFFGFYQHDVLQGYVQRVGEQLAALTPRRELVYRFTVIDTAEVKFFSLPGGYIYVSRGGLALLNSEAQLAAVLALQIAHGVAGHVRDRFLFAPESKQLGGGELGYYDKQFALPGMYRAIVRVSTEGYRERDELEAYRLAAAYLLRANYPPAALLALYDLLARPVHDAYLISASRVAGAGRRREYFRDQLAELIERTVSPRKDEAVMINRQQRFFSRLQGLRVDEDELIHRPTGQVLHPAMMFSVKMPLNWLSKYGANMILAFPESLDGYIKITGITEKPDGMQAGRINLQAHSSSPYGSIEEEVGIFGKQRILKGFFEVADQLYLVEAGAKNQQMWQEYYPQFQAAISTIMPLGKRDTRRVVEVNELALLVVSKPTTLGVLIAKNKTYAHVNLAWISYLNQINGSELLNPGRYIKVSK